MSDLRSKLIRLASEKPELRAHLLPLLRQGSFSPNALHIERSGEFFYQEVYHLTGLACEEMPKFARDLRDRLRQLIQALAKSSNIPVKVKSERSVVLMKEPRTQQIGYVAFELSGFLNPLSDVHWDSFKTKALRESPQHGISLTMSDKF